MPPSVILETLKLPLIAIVPVPLKFTHALKLFATDILPPVIEPVTV